MHADMQFARVYPLCDAVHSYSCPCLCTDRSIPLNCVQVRVVALGCTADLFKSPDAQNYLSTHPDFLQVLVQCLRVRCDRF